MLQGLRALAWMAGVVVTWFTGGTNSVPSREEARDIAVDAYVYAYPLVLMEVTRRSALAYGGSRDEGQAAVNRIWNEPKYRTASFRSVPYPEADVMYSSMWFDVSREPLLVHIPDPRGRYVMFPILDMWTNVFAAPGTRTTGPGAATFAIVGPNWQGALPEGVTRYRSPTAQGWMLGRVQATGGADLASLRRFQCGLEAKPLPVLATAPGSADRNTLLVNTARRVPDHAMPADLVHQGPGDAPRQDLPAPRQVERLAPQAFWDIFSRVVLENPPPPADSPLLDRMRRVGLVPGQRFVITDASPELRRVWLDAWPAARRTIAAYGDRMGRQQNGWRVQPSAVGAYGVDYLLRAAMASGGLGASGPEDAWIAAISASSDGVPLRSDARYVLHFAPGALPPAKGLWSLTLYDERHLLSDNPLGRHSLGERDGLSFNQDGSLDIFIQRASPGHNETQNWLPTPGSGKFEMSLRLYWPRAEALDGSWALPELRRVQPKEGAS
jgi:hypothetical protein